MKKLMIAALVVTFPVALFAQSGTKSPYSQFGLGALAEQTSGFNKGMNGIGYGLREHNQVNYLNPASYSALDSLTFLFDAGVSLQLNKFEENGRRNHAKMACFDYAVGAFRVAKNVGVGFGLIPYTNVGYSYVNTQNVNAFTSLHSTNATYTNTYSGEGGLHQAFLGAGWEPLKGLSLGFNVSYLWGQYNRRVVNTYSESYVNTLSRIYSATVRNYKLDLGLQYTAKVTRKDKVTLGLTYGLGHQLHTDAECLIISMNSQTATADTTRYLVENALAVPHVYGAGLAWNHHDKIKVGIDYQLQKWSKVDFPQYKDSGDKPTYELTSGLFTDRHKINVGGEYCKNERDRSFFNRLHYRAGFSYTTPYLKINGKDGPSEISVSAGLGIPIVNGYNNRSMLNISGQWVQQNADGFIKENSFRINIGFTFNERWFAKFKVE